MIVVNEWGYLPLELHIWLTVPPDVSLQCSSVGGKGTLTVQLEKLNRRDYALYVWD